MGETADQFPVLDLSWSRAGLCQGDDLAEVLLLADVAGNMLAAREPGGPGGEQASLVGLGRGNNTVGGHQDRTIEGFELLLLHPPRVAVVAVEVWILLESRIVVGGKHLGVCVYIDSGSLCLLKQHLQISEVVTADQDAGVLADSKLDLGDLGMTVGAGIGGIEQRHACNTPFTGLKGKGHQLIDALDFKQVRKSLLDESIQFFVLIDQVVGMLGVCTNALQTVGDQLLEAAHILIALSENPNRLGELCIGGNVSVIEQSSSTEIILVSKLSKQLLLGCNGEQNTFHYLVIIKVGVGNGLEEIVGDNVVYILVNLLSLGTESGGNLAQALGYPDHQIHQI
ncbi:hypothetical protein SDC9_96770 [bioreactor metagenome]|uniref:Uncharacterized protein n=1 Tax=bioreactor metagenome TaxID=1076179 RepID=A0A645AAU1_9ZZZZ